MSDNEEIDNLEEVSKNEPRNDKEERAMAKNTLLTVLQRYHTLVGSLSSDLSLALKQQITTETEKALKAAKNSVAILSRKQKKESKNSSRNLTHPCYVTGSFSKYVKALKAAGKLGSLKDPQVAAAIDGIINKNISSLLVTTLIISCDNYSQEKKKDVVFFATPLMKTHLSAELDKVKKDRDALIAREKQEAIARAAEAKKKGEAAPEEKERGPFNPENYGSALNNVIAAYLRDKEQSTSDKETLNDEALASDLAALQEHLKAHNQSLRDTRK